MSKENAAEKLIYDVLLVGGSPSSLALAHKLTDLAFASGTKLKIAILEKSKEFGGHVISGAVSHPHVLERLFPNYKEEGFPVEAVCKQSYLSLLGVKGKWDIPSLAVPPGMKKENYLVLTLSKVVLWMVNKLKEKLKGQSVVEIDFFPGFAAHHILYEGDKVVGVSVAESITEGSELDENVYAKVTCFGDKGFTSGSLLERFKLRENPQIWSVGVKEVWELAEGKDYAGQVWHTLGYPLTDGSFGGGFVYGMKDNQLTIGMVISLDSPNPNINPQQRLQGFKKHPWLQKMIAGGKLKNYGAAVLPEGGYYSLPKEFAVDGALLLGDALGVLDINSLAGIDKALECGIQAAEVIHEQINAKNDFSSKGLAKYKERLMKTHVGKALFKGRYFRHAFQTNPKLLGDYLPKILDAVDEGVPLAGFASIGLKQPLQAIKAALKLKDYIEGNKDFGTIKYKQDHEHIVPEFKEPLKVGFRRDFAKSTIYSREDAVFYSHTKYHEENKHIDEFNAQVCLSCIEKYDALKKETPCVSDCTAEVHRVDVKNDLRIHGMSLENCVQCRTCEIVCPERNLKVKPTAQGAGPDFMGM